METEKIIDDLCLIDNVVVNYSQGRRRGLTDEETEDRALKAVSLAMEILEKQIPKQPLFDNNGGCEYYEEWIECPVCGEAIPEYTAENETKCFCVGCGQKLSWGGIKGLGYNRALQKGTPTLRLGERRVVPVKALKEFLGE